ncbi:acid phosphatase type 7-like [Gigantopelta aegis]|uniref:acid phosphatase type 7-like n=1 Tax=Gigantopelta aegis TaxID=1735272 RepID=UPI001B88C0E5|nr:acid phosphatase type 7-like [Gigantopelta aegis]
MGMERVAVLTFALLAFSHIDSTEVSKPEQVHLSYGRNASEMVVTWSTQNVKSDSIVKYGLDSGSLNMEAKGYSTKFVDGGQLHHTQYIHRVRLINLKPGQTYYYTCGSSSGWSAVFWFKAMRVDKDWSPSIALYGDMGNTNAQSLPRLKKEVNMYDAILHIGDFAYDMFMDNGTIGDEFMQKIQTVAAHLPYMTCPGNHESTYNFSNYKNRFTMPGDEDSSNMFYSFDMGPVHFISISTEYYFFLQYGVIQVVKQFYWLERHLKEVTSPAYRAKHPWIILFGHRPMYCSNNDADDCSQFESRVRCGIPYLHWLCLEKLLYNYGVDVAFWAHEHSYERLWPTFDRKVYNGSIKEPYTNPRAPVHIITGSAGCKERHDKFIKHRPEWSAFRSDDYGYTRIKILNSSHLQLQQVSDDQGGKVIDEIMIIKDKHGPY